MSHFQNFMKKKLGGKYPVAEGQHLANPYFDPTVPSTPVSARASDGGGARRGGGGGGRRVTNLLLKQNLTRQQLSKAYPTSRTDKILKLSKAHTDYNEGELLGKGNETPYDDKNEEENEHEIHSEKSGESNTTGKEHHATHSEVVKEGNTIKSTIGYIRTADDADGDLNHDDNIDDNEKAKESEVGPPQDAPFVTNDHEEIGSHFSGDNLAGNTSGDNEEGVKKKKRKTSKEIRQAKPKTKERSTARSHQNFRERYLTLKKRVDVLQPDHGLDRDFLLVVKNNLQNPNVKGAASTAGKWMVYGRGDVMSDFMSNGAAFNKKKMVVMANAFNFKEVNVADDADDADEVSDVEDENEEPEMPSSAAKRPRRENREESPEPDIYNMRASAISVRTPGT